jgi:hypothetical protein
LAVAIGAVASAKNVARRGKSSKVSKMNVVSYVSLRMLYC